MKNYYETPELEIIRFTAEDIITTSGGDPWDDEFEIGDRWP